MRRCSQAIVAGVDPSDAPPDQDITPKHWQMRDPWPDDQAMGSTGAVIPTPAPLKGS
jgi:hypothetical protein